MSDFKHLYIRFLFLFAILSLSFVSCDDPNEGELFIRPTDDVSEMAMMDVLESSPETYSMWISFLKYADYYNAIKNTDIATLFCPNNSAVEAFLKERGLESIEELDLDYAKKVVQIHIIDAQNINDSTLDNYAQNKEAMTDPTLFGSYLSLSYGYTLTDVDDEYKTDSVYSGDTVFINNEAHLVKNSVVCTNGTYYTLGDVIHPLTETITEKIENYGEYTIFASAIRQNSHVDSLAGLVRDTTYSLGVQIVTEHRFTCFAVPDYVYNEAGITDVAGLKRWLVENSNGEYTDEDEALEAYLMYHFLVREYSCDEIFNFTGEDETIIYDTQLSGQAITANETNSTRYLNGGVQILRSDIEACNGYINKINGIMPIYHPGPVLVRWDFLNSADIIAAVNSYGANNGLGNLFTSSLTSGEIKVDLSDDHLDGNFGEFTSFTYEANETKSSIKTYYRVGFYKEQYVSATQSTEPKHGAYMNNYLCLNLGYAGWAEFTTPVIIAGTYKVVLHYIKDITLSTFFTTGTMTRFDIDGEKSIVYLYKGQSKQPLYDNIDITLWQKMTFDSSVSHTFKITMMDINAKTNSLYRQMLDYVEFIPMD